MHFRYIISISLIFIHISIFCQNRSDYSWVFGQNFNDSIPGTEGTVINFNDHKRTISYQPIFPDQAIGSSIASISDENTGELLFFSNGCTVFDKTFHMMENGDSLNEGDLRDYYCEESGINYYPYAHGVIIIKIPNSETQYYIIQKSVDWTDDLTDIYYDKIRYSVVDMSLNEGLGKVIVKNEILYEGDELGIGYLTMIPHENQTDWWIVQPKLESNEYVRILLTENGFVSHDNQILGDSISGQGQAMFSPDGSMFALFNGREDYHLFDFDRNTGYLSNFRSLKFNEPTFGLGMCFSPSGQYTYLMRNTEIYQVDNTLDDLYEGLILIDTLTPASEGFTASFAGGVLAPDCKIYITHLSSTRFLTVINSPDEKGIGCNLVQRGLRMPYFHFIGSIPNFPHFRIDEEDICDSTITNVLEIPWSNQLELDVFPNPTSGFFTLWTNKRVEVKLFNIHGQLVHSINSVHGKREVNISNISNGMYYIHITDDKGRTRNFKLIKTE